MRLCARSYSARLRLLSLPLWLFRARFNGVPVLPHDKYSGPFVGVAGAHTVECSRPVRLLHPAIWEVRTDLNGLWCTGNNIGNTFWSAGPGANYPALDFVLRFELEPSNGNCPCHGISVPPWPPADPNPLVAIEMNGTRMAGHADFNMAQQVSGALRASWQAGSIALLTMRCHYHARWCAPPLADTDYSGANSVRKALRVT